MLLLLFYLSFSVAVWNGEISVQRIPVVPILAAVLSLLFVVVIHRHRARERRKELFLMRRHADNYADLHKSPW